MAAEAGRPRLSRLSRRGLLGLAGVGGAGAAAGIAAGLLGHDPLAAAAAPPANDSVVPFFGDRQAGITTPAQDRLHMAAFDVTTEDRTALVELLKDWTAPRKPWRRADPPVTRAPSTAPTTPRRRTPARPSTSPPAASP